MKPQNLNSVADLKNACDETLPAVFASLGYTESFTLTDTKLALGYITVLLAGGLYLAEKKFENNFSNSLYYNLQAILVGVFIIVNSTLWVFTKFILKKIKYTGINQKGEKIQVSTWCESNTEPVYQVEITGVKQFQIDLTKVFNQDGFLEFQALKAAFSSQMSKKSI